MSFEWEISTEELENKIQEGCPLIDIRNAGNIAYGMIPGAIAISQEAPGIASISSRTFSRATIE